MSVDNRRRAALASAGWGYLNGFFVCCLPDGGLGIETGDGQMERTTAEYAAWMRQPRPLGKLERRAWDRTPIVGRAPFQRPTP